MSTVITTGVRNPNGQTPLVARQEIRKLAEDTDLMNLYLLGLQRFQSQDQKDPLSWFQIAGIHGRPYIPYADTEQKGHSGGYCTHSSILFPPWHRPYLALFEQTLYNHVVQIASEYQDPDEKARYTAAAQRFRVPYWDWAENADLPDFVAKQTEVTVYSPKGSQKIANPLYQYKFHPMYSNFGDGLPEEKTWESWQETLRWPTTNTSQAQSQGDAMDRNLANNRYTVRDRTYNLLVQATSYEAFSNDGFLGNGANPTHYDSLESIHGQIHGMTGKNGHMAVVDYAAFDPVFWLHHTNCDRVFALWQALNPQQYVIPKENDAGTFATPAGTVEDMNSPLYPFWQNPNEYWTPVTVRDTRTLNYTYPELEKWSSLSADQKRVRLKTDINAMYGRSAAFATIRADLFNALPPTKSGPLSQSQSQPKPAAAATTTPAAPPSAPATTSGTKPTGATAGTAQQPAKPSPAPPVAHPAEASRPAQPPASTSGAPAGPAARPAPALAAAAQPPAQVRAGAAPVFATPAIPQRVMEAARPVPPHRESSGHETTGAQATVHPTALAARQPPAHAIPRSGDEPISIEGVKDQPAAADGKKQYNEWIANITVEKYAAKKTFFVYIFLGDFTTDPHKWGEDPNLVGQHVVFANKLGFTGCERCRDAAEQHKLVTGTIPLTGALGDRLGKGHLADLAPRDIVPYLKKELHWRIMDQEDNVIERADIPSLKISVAHTSVAVPDDIASFPTWGQSQKEAEVTKGRPAGAEEED